MTLLAALGAPAAANYDRDGRYVPSPNGVPADPNARYIPLSPGNPGGGRGTQWEPPSPRATPPAAMAPKPDRQNFTPVLVPLTRAQCAGGWSAKARVPRVEFNRRCSRMKKKP